MSSKDSEAVSSSKETSENEQDKNGYAFRIRNVDEINSEASNESNTSEIGKRKLPDWLASSDDENKKKSRKSKSSSNEGGPSTSRNFAGEIETNESVNNNNVQVSSSEINNDTEEESKPDVKIKVENEQTNEARSNHDEVEDSPQEIDVKEEIKDEPADEGAEEPTSSIRDSCKYGIRCYRDTEERKISLSINKEQLEFLTKFMETHRDLARNKLNTGNGRQQAKNLWEKISKSLNEKGPPLKQSHGWKKVWADYKHKIKGKLTFNAMNMKKIAEGEYAEKRFSIFEESVIASCGLKAHIINGTCETSSSSASVNLPSVSSVLDRSTEAIDLNQTDNSQLEAELYIEQSKEIEQIEDENYTDIGDFPQEPVKSKKRSSKDEKNDIFKKYVKSIEENTYIQRQILKVMEKSYTLQEKTFKLREKKFHLEKKRIEQESKRQNEALKVQKLDLEMKIEETRLKRLELEQRKDLC